MTKTLPLDPFNMWKTLYEQTEASWNGAIQETLKKESFSQGLGETLNYVLQYQELANEATESMLKKANMPTRSELADVASLIVNVENKLDDLDDKFDEEINKLDTAKEINQLKRTVANLDKKLDRVLDAVESIGKLKLNEAVKLNETSKQNDTAKVNK